MKALVPILLVALSSAGLSGCSDKMEAHLEKYRSPETGEAAKLPAPPDVYSLGDSKEVADRVHAMTFDEASQRLGAHRYQSKVEFTFTKDKERVKLKEEDLIVQAANGDFRVKVDNHSGQGYELVYSADELFVRNRFNPFHKRSKLDGMHRRWRNKAYDAWGAIYRLYRGGLHFSKQGLTRHHGRDALAFRIGLSAEGPHLPGTPEPAKVPDGVKKYVYPVQPTPADRDRWRDKAQAQSAEGRLVVDADEGCVLQVDFRGKLAWLDEAGETVRLEVKADILSDGFGNPAAIPAPEADEVEPLPQRISVDTRPLDPLYGKGYTARLGAPAGVAATRAKDKDKKEKGGKNKPSEDSGGSSSKP